MTISVCVKVGDAKGDQLLQKNMTDLHLADPFPDGFSVYVLIMVKGKSWSVNEINLGAQYTRPNDLTGRIVGQ